MNYQDLKEDPLAELRKVLNYLKIAPNERRLDCLGENIEGSMRRNQQNISSPYTREQREIINRVIKTANNLLLKKKKVKIRNYMK